MNLDDVVKYTTIVSGIFQVGAIVGAWVAWQGVREAVKDSQVRSQREAGLLAIKEAEIFAEKLIPEYSNLLPLIRGRLGGIGEKEGDFRPHSFKTEAQMNKFREAVKNVLYQTPAGGLCVEFSNKLESFAMAFTKRIADEAVIYESVARTYCDMVEELYFYYCDQRINKHSGGYENTIVLYRTWRKRLQLPELYAARGEIDQKISDASDVEQLGKPLGV
jgi:hypothetical protein